MTDPAPPPDPRPPSFHEDVRERILPELARLDGLGERLPEIQRFFDLLAGRDLDFDVRERPPFSSNLCEQDCALELAYTFGGHDDCGVRYSFEPTCRRTALKNRYTLCRDRMKAAMRAAGDGYDVDLFSELFKIGVPNDVLLAPFQDPTATIGAVHHYRDRPPRLKIYFSVDYPTEPPRALAQIRRLVGRLAEPRLDEQVERFLAAYDPPGGGRMVGFDFAPHTPTEVKVYKEGKGLSRAALAAVVEDAGGGDEARAGIAHFQDIFLDGDRDPARFDLVTLAPSRERAARLKLYIRPVDLYSDAEALRRLRAWYRHLRREDELALVERGLAAVAPLSLLDATKGFFNYLSVDVGAAGVAKTSVYYAPLVSLRAREMTQPRGLRPPAANS